MTAKKSCGPLGSTSIAPKSLHDSVESAADVDQLPAGLFRKLVLRILLPLAIGYSLCTTDRMNMGMAQLQMAEDLQMTQAAFGAASSIFFVTYTALQIPANHLLVQVGSRCMLACYMICWGFVAAAQSFAKDTMHIMALRLVLGCAESGYFPGVIYVISCWCPRTVLGQSNALFLSMASVSSTLISGSGGYIMDALDGALRLRGWRWLFIIQGLASVPLGVFLLLFLSESPDHATWLTPAERAYMRRQAHEETVVTASLRSAVCRLVGLRTTWVMGIAWFGFTLVGYTFAFFGPRLTRDIIPAWSATTIGLVGMLPQVISIVGRPLMARWADQGDSRRKVFVVWGLLTIENVALLLCVLPIMLAGLHGSAGVNEGRFYFIMSNFVLVWIIADNAGVFWQLHHRHQPQDLRAPSIAMINMFGQVGGLVGPYVFGVIHDQFGALCPSEVRRITCAAEWGLPLVLFVGFKLVLAMVTGAAAFRLGFARVTSVDADAGGGEMQKGMMLL